MKKVLIFILIFCVLTASVLTVRFAFGEPLPQKLIYNYFEYNEINKFIFSLKDYLVVKKSTCFEVIPKNSEDSYVLGENIFDVNKTIFFLLGKNENTLYTIESTDRTSFFAYDLDTNKKALVSSNTEIANENGILGLEKLFGIALAPSDISSLLYTQGTYWISSDGVKKAKDVAEFLASADKSNEFGIDPKTKKIAETDSDIFTLNKYSEILKYNKAEKTFSVAVDVPVSEFFITETHIYYTKPNIENALFRSDYDGKNEEKILNITPVNVRFTDTEILLTDNAFVYDLSGNKLAELKGKNFDADSECIYIYDTDTKTVEYKKRN